jgi:hypothetical protein
MDYHKFTNLKGCTSCMHFPGPYFKRHDISSPIECYDCWDNMDKCFSNYIRKKYI